MPRQVQVNLCSISVAKHTLGFHDQRHTEFLRFREDIEGKHRALLCAAGISISIPSDSDINEANVPVVEDDEQQETRISKSTARALRKTPSKVTNELRDFTIRHPAMSRYRGQLLSGYNADNVVGEMLRNCLEYVLELTVQNLVRRDGGIRSLMDEAAEVQLQGPEPSNEKVAGTAREIIDLTEVQDSPPPLPEREVIVIEDDDNVYGDLYSNPWQELQALQAFMSPPQTPQKEAPVNRPLERETTPERASPSVPQPPTPAPSSPFSVIVPPPPSEDLKRTYAKFAAKTLTRLPPRKKLRISQSIDTVDAVTPQHSPQSTRRYGPAAGRRDKSRDEAGKTTCKKPKCKWWCRPSGQGRGRPCEICVTSPSDRLVFKSGFARFVGT
ncbi:hypothetical protein ABW21_db0206471 [Orbilia brochopaga]|nr:hypothetical protein ABW21_db0206471 [Drechslerella brochopaga]